MGVGEGNTKASICVCGTWGKILFPGPGYGGYAVGVIIGMSRAPVSPQADHLFYTLPIIQEHVYTTGAPPTTVRSELT